MSPPGLLTERALSRGVRWLSARDSDLARVLDEHGPPPLRARKPGFPALAQIMLEQQVSLASARAVYQRLVDRVSPLSPSGFLELDETTLREIGFSRQKARYVRELSFSLLEGRLDLDALAGMDDARVRWTLTRVPGIGPWTADIYLLTALLRPDVWPAGDLALAAAAQKVKSLPACPRPGELAALASAWAPWRAVAARMLWHHYLSTR